METVDDEGVGVFPATIRGNRREVGIIRREPRVAVGDDLRIVRRPEPARGEGADRGHAAET